MRQRVVGAAQQNSGSRENNYDDGEPAMKIQAASMEKRHSWRFTLA
jgi:hypothetical protein